MATSSTEPSVLPVDCAALRLIRRGAAAYQSHYDRWLEVRAARQKADELAESNAIEAIMAKAAENSARGASKTSALRPNILVTAAMDEEGLAALRQLGEVRYESFREHLRLLTGEDLVEALAGVQVFITEVDAVDAEVLSKAPDLRVVASCRGNAVNRRHRRVHGAWDFSADDAGAQRGLGR